MDSNNSEHFVYVKDEDFDPWSIAIDELIQWFSECWKEVGGESFQLDANMLLMIMIRRITL